MEIKIMKSRIRDYLNLGREWTHYFGIGWWNGPCIYVTTYLTKYPKNFIKENPLVETKVFAGQASIGLNLKNWTVGQYHQYYDGDNCSYFLGPLYFTNMMGSGCKKCREGNNGN
jgi:hypothetical protein